jgi:branched-subunit amino acid aminotransferase/4-amino-4-deoxychorismate lyase
MRIPRPETVAWLDGRRVAAGEIRLPIDDPACHAGLGVFETLAVRDGRALDVQQHLERLAGGAEKLGMDPIDREALAQSIRQAAAAAPSARAWLKLMLTRGGRRLVLLGEADSADEGRSVSAVLLPWRRNPADPLDGLKTLSYAANVLGLEEARRRGADEGVWLNTRGHLAEACTSNLFVVQGRKLFTAGVGDGILPGVVRGLALRAARELGIAVHEGRVRLVRLERAREAFLTSSLTGVRPLVRFGGQPVGRGCRGRITEDIAQRVERMRDPVRMQ